MSEILSAHYELMFIVPGSIDESQVPEVKQRVTALVTAADATISYEEDMGRRRLAYPILHQTHGHYFVMEFDVLPAALKELDRKIRLDSDVLRYLIVTESAKTSEQTKRMIERRKVTATKRAEHAAALAEKEKPKVEIKPVPAVDLDTDDLKTSAAKVSIEELDKKLDAILDDSDLEAKL